jgi:hypothetical protein
VRDRTTYPEWREWVQVHGAQKALNKWHLMSTYDFTSCTQPVRGLRSVRKVPWGEAPANACKNCYTYAARTWWYIEETTVMAPEANESAQPDEVIGNDDETHLVELHKPSVPVTINELSALDKKRGMVIVEARTAILEKLREASIQLTMPNDWTLFRTTDDRGTTDTAFLADQGCDRIKKLWQIQIDNIRTYDRIDDNETGTYAYRLLGDGFCGATGERVYDVEGIRYSDERYAQEKPEGIQRQVAVRKAARANLDGGITRELTGLKSVPREELDRVWKKDDLGRRSSQCAKGRGFGSKDQRLGRGDEKTAEVDPADVPECGICGVKLVFRPKGNPPFWGCPSYTKHPKDKVIVNHEDLLRHIAAKKARSEKPGDETE